MTDLGWEAVMDVDSVAAKRVRAELIRATADGPDVIGAAHFPFGHVISVGGDHQFRPTPVPEGGQLSCPDGAASPRIEAYGPPGSFSR